jgi:hypothetical protein
MCASQAPHVLRLTNEDDERVVGEKTGDDPDI